MDNKEKSTIYKERVSSASKTKAWHIAKTKEIDSSSQYDYHYEKDAVNYDLVNGILNQSDFEYVTKPYGITPKAYIPEEMQNFPILTNNFKYLEGELLKRPRNNRVTAVNAEAISEYSKKKGELISQFVVGQIKKERIKEAMSQNPEMGDEELKELEETIMSPEEIEVYMGKDYRDSYEVLGKEIYSYLDKKLHLKEIERTAWKHGLASGKEIYYVGIEYKSPVIRAVNPLRFDCDLDPDMMFIHDASWARTIDYMNPSKVVSLFPKLTAAEVSTLYSRASSGGGVRKRVDNKWEIESGFDMWDDFDDYDNDNYNHNHKVKVIHYTWRTEYKVGFLTFMDEDGSEQTIKVPETYKLNKERGDLYIKWEWFPEIRQITEIDGDIYTEWGRVEDLPIDPDNPYYCPLQYTGVIHNNLNSKVTGPVDLMKPYQYMYNIVYRMIQKDLASDKGRKLIANINQIPTSMGIDLNKWQHYLEVDDIIWVNPNEEGNRNNNDLTSWRNVDMSAAQSIDKKIQLLEYIEAQCSKVIGMNDARLGQQGGRELVGTTQQQILQSNYSTEPWFATHELGKKAALELLLNVAKTCYHKYPKSHLVYTLSDLSRKIIELDVDKLPFAHFSVFISDSSEDMRMYEELKQIAHAAVQTQAATLSSIATMIRGNASPGELVEMLKKGEEKIQQIQQQSQQAEQESNMSIEEAKKEIEMLKLELEKYKIDVDNATRVEVAKIGTFKFLEDQDSNDNGVPDQLEIAKFQADSKDKEAKLKFEADKFNKNIELEKEKLKIKEKELKIKEKVANKKPTGNK